MMSSADGYPTESDNVNAYYPPDPYSHPADNKKRFRDDEEGYSKRRRRSGSRSRSHRDRSRSPRSKRDDRDRDRRGNRDRERRRSRSPRRRERSPEIVPIDQRPKKLHNWDVPPPGYEGMTAEQVKATGHFPLPSQLAVARMSSSGFPTTVFTPPVMADSRSSMMGRPPQGASGPAAQNATIARQAKRLYVGNIPFDVNESTIADFFNNKMNEHNLGVMPGNSVVSVQVNHDKNYAFVEFRDPQEATNAMALDGLSFKGQSLKIRRPKDYQGPEDVVVPNVYLPGVVSTNVPDTPNKIFIGGLPTYLNEDQVMELLKSFGELRAFNLVKDSQTGTSKGYAFCEYADPSITDVACQGLNNMELGDKKLIVQRASVGAKGVTNSGGNVLPGGIPFSAAGGIGEATRVLLLLNMVLAEELENDEEYQDILLDVKEECEAYGKVLSVDIPRPSPDQEIRGVGKIFVLFETKDQCSEALRALAGRQFAQRTVLASYFPEDKYHNKEF